MLSTAPAWHLLESLRSSKAPGANEPDSTADTPATKDELPWYQTNHRWTTFNAHFQTWDPAIAARLSADEILANVVKSNANVFMMWAVDCLGNAFYPSKVARPHPNLRDPTLLAKIVAGCRKHDIAVIFYYGVSWNKFAAERHPDWTMRDNQNRVLGYDSVLGPFLCYNSGYLDYVKAATQELLGYKPDGLFYDMMWFGNSGTVCYDQKYCQPLFRQHYGVDMPLSPTWDDSWRKFLDFRYESNLRFARALTQYAREIRPEVSVGYNYHGQPPFSWQVGMKPVDHSAISDYSTGESLPYLLGHWYPSLLTMYARSLRPNAPTMMATTRCIRVYSDYTMRAENDLKWEVFTYLSHGTHAFVIDDALYDGSLQSQFYDRLGRLFAEAKQKEPYFGFDHVREVGLYYSLKSRDWFGRDKPKQYQDAFLGAHRALTELHIPVDAVFDETVTLERLNQYPIIFLPNTAILSDAEVRLLRQYVMDGGRLLATGEAGLYDDNGEPLPDSILGELLGFHFRGKADFATHYYRLPRGFLSTDTIPDWDVLVPGPANIVEPAGAQALGDLKVAFQDGPPFHPIGIGNHNSAWNTAGPAVLLNSYGRGKTAYLPLGVDAAYVGDYPSPEHRLLLRNLIRHLYPTPRIRVEAPLTVEAVLTEDAAKRRYLVHMIGCQGTRVVGGMWSTVKPSMAEEPLIYRARIFLDRPIQRVSSLSEKTQIHREENTVALQIEDVHETVIITV
jgi:hypothetical protein